MSVDQGYYEIKVAQRGSTLWYILNSKGNFALTVHKPAKFKTIANAVRAAKMVAGGPCNFRVRKVTTWTDVKR